MDEALQGKLCEKPTCCQYHEQIIAMTNAHEAAHDDKTKNRDQKQRCDQPQFFADHGKNEIGMGIG